MLMTEVTLGAQKMNICNNVDLCVHVCARTHI